MLVERTTDGGRKILISGGGRCNVLPAALQPERFISDSPAHLVRHMLRAWPLDEQKQFFEEELRVPLKFEDDSSKYFPASNRARDVRDALAAFARRRGVEIQFGITVKNIARSGDAWRVETSRDAIDARAVIIATGGLSVPDTGSDGAGLRFAAAFGHTVHDLYPALTPLIANPPVHASLSGLSLEVRIRAKVGGKVRTSEGGFLFTHRGYSGPAVLDISDMVTRAKGARAKSARARGSEPFSTEKTDLGTELSTGSFVPQSAKPVEKGSDPLALAPVLRVQWGELDAEAWEPLLTRGVGHVASLLAGSLPERLVTVLMHEAAVPPDRRISDLRRNERLALIEKLTASVLPWTGDEGFKKAEVTGGGVALDEVHLKTLESRRAPGLYFCGEVLDAFGPIGGHNFAWAWSTGRTAGRAALGQRAEGKGQR